MPYFDVNLDLTHEDRMIRDAAHRFAKEVARPLGVEADRLTAEAAVGPDAPIWSFLRQAFELGYHKAAFPEAVGGLGFSPIQSHIAFEELFWGSIGLTGALTLAMWPYIKLLQSGNEELIREFVVPFCACGDGSLTGGWGIMEPDHGSDHASMGEACYTDPTIRGQVRARLDGDAWIINGQKAAWVSCGPIASHLLLNVQLDPSLGLSGGGVCILPLDLPGVSRGKPLEKLGQRDLPQGEIYFDDVRIPTRYLFVGPEEYPSWVAGNLGFGNTAMTLLSLGVARAAFDETFAYVKERIQGGAPLLDHWAIKVRIGRLYSKVEAIRAMSRAAWNLALRACPTVSEYAFAAKVFCTETAQAVTAEGMQLHGANGLTKEYLIEKLFRDARALSTEDGDNDTLARLCGQLLRDTYPRPHDSVAVLG